MSQAPNTFVIAEAGVNHDGSLDKAKSLIEIAVEAGANAVKFQSFKADEIATRSAPKARYQLNSTIENESQQDMLRKLELSDEAHFTLAEHCHRHNIEFLSTPFDVQYADLLVDKIGMSRLKVPSGEITNAHLLLHIARKGKPMIVSTGMCTLSDIETALGIIAFGLTGRSEKPSSQAFRTAYVSQNGHSALKNYVTLLHCTSAYPAPFSQVNLKAIHGLETAFGLPVGFSDHTEGISASIAAVALGARVIEKHFTLDRNAPGPDHKASLEPHELKTLVTAIRQTEAALGSAVKSPSDSELEIRKVARRSLVALTDIQLGEVLNETHIAAKRPGDGISAIEYWDWLGTKSRQDYSSGEPLKP